MVLCRSRSGYEPIGADRHEYIAYKFFTRITLCTLVFAVCMIVMLYASAYCCADEIDDVNANAFYDPGFPGPPNVRKTRWLKETYSAPRKAKNMKSMCSAVPDAEKFDCFPNTFSNEKLCNARGCCWQHAGGGGIGVPWCFFPKNYGGYKYLNVTNSNTGVRAFMKRTFPSPYGYDIKLVRMDAIYQSSNTLRVRILDPLVPRYEPPYPEVPLGPDEPPRTPNYKFEVNELKTGFKVTRNNGDIIFDAIDKGAFIFADQFLQISAAFNGKIYGLGEHQTNFQLSTEWQRLTMWNHDNVPVENMNLYGSHPFYMVIEPSGKCHGVFFLNSNAMDVILQPLPAVTFRSIGGIFDFYFFTGPTPADVVRQYQEVIGRPFMPPYWSLGFHLSRYGYGSAEKTRTVWQRTRDAGIPFDTQWNDIDYMDNNNDFTYDKNKFKTLPQLVKDIHDAGMRYIVILDPGISGCEPEGTYPPYDEGVAHDVFIKHANGSILVGKVWNPKCTVFPDFTDPATTVYWTRHCKILHKTLPYDGLWIDMNEPSNFVDGSMSGCPDNSLEHPPFLPSVHGDKLYYKSLCMSAQQYAGPHYDVHNLYGLSEAIATNRALKEITGKRPFIISRSSFPGLGKFSGHWSGDVQSSWYDMKKSIPQLLAFSLYGIPMMGADICGFNGNTTKMLCQRWSQLGAFYPFSRNHNTDNGIDQDPVALGPEVVKSAKNALIVRYTLLPYLYTLFWKAHRMGDTVARPLFFEFLEDKNTHAVDSSFLWGCCILIVPVLEQSATTVATYLPSGRWYDWYTGLGRDSQGSNVTLNAPSDYIPVLIRGGVVLPTQVPNVTTTLSRQNDVVLIAAFSETLTGSGSLYWDDGESMHNEQYDDYGLVEFTLAKTNLTSRVVNWKTKSELTLGSVKFYGFFEQIKKLTFNGKDCKFKWNSTSLVLTVSDLKHPMHMPFVLSWSQSSIQ